MQSARSASWTWMDPAGICLSLLCGIHCLAGPFLVIIFPLASLGIFSDEHTEILLICSSVLFAGASLTWGFRVHQQQRIFLALGAAILFLATGRTILEGPYEITFVAAGAALLTFGHALNYRLCRSCVLCDNAAAMKGQQRIIQASALSLGYNGHSVLREVALEIRTGEFWCFLGQNGGGKTTLMKAILGLLPPQAGHLWRHPILASRERTGFVPQRCEFNPTLPTTVREFVLLGLVGMPRLKKDDEEERLSWVFQTMGIADLARHNYWALSDGQRQRALVARALVRRPTLLVLDEPTNHLDAPTEEALLQFLASLNQEQGQTLLFVTHNVGIAAHYATHVALLNAGHVLAGPKEQTLTAANLAPLSGTAAGLGFSHFGTHSLLPPREGSRA